MIATLPSSLLAALPIAVAAGFVSFISPCVLPLLPGYLAFLSGAAGSLEGRSGRGRAVIGAVAFIIGFAIVFVSLGALFGGFGALLRDDERILSVVFGVITILLGMFFGGWWPSSWLNRERRIHYLPRASILGAGALDSSSRSGGRPASVRRWGRSSDSRRTQAPPRCAVRSSRSSTVSSRHPVYRRRARDEWVSTASSWLHRHQRTIGRIGGLLLIVIGILEVTGAWHSFVLWLQVHFPSSTSFM